MKEFTIQKIDTDIHVKGFSGKFVYYAMYIVIASLLLFVLLYILIGTFTSVAVCIPLFFVLLYRLTGLQKKYGSNGWGKKNIAKKLPEFITVKKRFIS